jgi:hypothetical protein
MSDGDREDRRYRIFPRHIKAPVPHLLLMGLRIAAFILSLSKDAPQMNDLYR